MIDYQLKQACLKLDFEEGIIDWYSSCHLRLESTFSSFGKPVPTHEVLLLEFDRNFKDRLLTLRGKGYKIGSIDGPAYTLVLYEDFFKYYKIKEKDIPYYKKCNEMYLYFTSNYPDLWDEAGRIWNATKQRRYKLRKKIEDLFQEYDKLCFLSMTFTDEYLSKTTQKNRRKYISSYLCGLGVPYVGNIDFGLLNGREHYHALVARRLSKSELEQYRSKFGNLFVEMARKSRDAGKMSKYIAKLTNHAIKQTTKRSALLYSRDYQRR